MKSLDIHARRIIGRAENQVITQVGVEVRNTVMNWRWGKVAGVRRVKDNVTILITQMKGHRQ